MKSVNYVKRQSRPTTSDDPATDLVLTSLATKLTQFGASLAAITAVSLVVGYGSADTYYRHLGVPWIVGLMSPGQLVAFGANMSLIMTMSAFGAITYLFGRKKATTVQLEVVRNSLAVLSAVVAIPVFHGNVSWVTPTVAHGIFMTSAVLAACAFGASIAELVVRLTKSNLRWESAHMALLLLMFSYGLLQAPRGYALAAAHRDVNAASSDLAVVQTDDIVSPERAWRLVAIFDKSALLVSLADDPAQRVFRFATVEELRRIHSHRDAG